MLLSNLASVLVALVAAGASVAAAQRNATRPVSGPLDVIVHDRKLYVSGTEFYIKAMAYHPTPLGWGSMETDGKGGGGFCSPKLTPWREWISACWDSDYFDGSSGLARTPPGPEKWFADLWKRDFPILQDLGVNTIRIYNVNPTTRLATENMLAQRWNKIQISEGKDHRPFMEAAQAHGIKVMFPLVADETALTTDPDDLLDQKIKNIIDEVGDHPALLMWVIGNEIVLSDPAKQNLRVRINQKMDLARNYTLQRHNRIIPITTCVIDLPESYDFLARNLNVDLFCTNAGYRADSLTDLFTGNAKRNFTGFSKLSQETGMPTLIGEIGWLSLNNTINEQQPQWFNKVWKDVLKYKTDGCIGGVYFEYSDEKYKQSGPDQTQLGVVEVFVNSNAAGQSSLDQDVFLPDIVRPKRIIYNAVKNGTLSGEPFNFNMDVWKYFGKPPDQLVVKNDRPPVPVSVPTGTAIPPTSSGVPTTTSSPSRPPAGGASPFGARPRETNEAVVLAQRVSAPLVPMMILLCVAAFV